MAWCKDYKSILSQNADVAEDAPVERRMWEITAKAMCVVKNKQWEICLPFTSGRTVTVRDLIPRITKVFQKIESFGSVAAGLDPIHAAIPFAGVCVLVEVS